MARRNATRKRPVNTSVTMYNVGFGDCFLLTFSYADGKHRRVLIDCGTSSQRKSHMSKVVNQLTEDCEGHVDALVATHRHSDHISAFGLTGVGGKLAALKPKVVIQPWTEHPKAEEGALEAATHFSGAATKYVKGLKEAQNFAQYLTKESSRILENAAPELRKELRRIAKLNISNKDAIFRLTEMGGRRGEGLRYVHAGGRCGLERLLPGVRVTVLGPPTLKQSEGKTKSQTSWDEEEFWKLQGRLAAAAVSNWENRRGNSILFPGAQTDPVSTAPSCVRWVAQKLNAGQLLNVQRLVTKLNDALNNTSVVLLFEVGDKALLFPGDAQLESWQYILANGRLRKRLQGTSLYKVGHHGSTNATPKSLWGLFDQRSTDSPGLISLLSTKSGEHSKVPRASLVKALKDETDFHSTRNWSSRLSETYVL